MRPPRADDWFGTLRGVRGFNDPRAIRLANGNPVWFQTNDAGETYAPFRLNIKETNATWMGALPHSWTDQVDARNGGRYDRWLQNKRSGNREFADMPLTLGYYNREDINRLKSRSVALQSGQPRYLHKIVFPEFTDAIEFLANKAYLTRLRLLLRIQSADFVLQLGDTLSQLCLLPEPSRSAELKQFSFVGDGNPGRRFFRVGELHSRKRHAFRTVAFGFQAGFARG